MCFLAIITRRRIQALGGRKKKWAGRTEVVFWQYSLAEKWEPSMKPQGLFTTIYDGENPGREKRKGER